jgi:ComF family protein
MTHDSGSINPSIQQVVQRCLNILLPPACVACGALVSSENGLCAACWEQVDFIGDPVCAQCGRPFEFDPGEGSQCAACLKKPPLYDRARSAVVYGETSRRFILSYKHGDRLDMVPSMVSWLERAGEMVITDADLIAPVPLHWSRFLSRRFNQSAELARVLSRRTDCRYMPELLIRKKRTTSQAGLNARERAKNVRGAFAVKSKHMDVLEGKRVLLVDDVLTTGSTLNACAGVLLWAGASAVDVLTLARVVRAEKSEAR